MSELSLVHLSAPARTGDAPHPALVLLHGLGSNEQDLFTLGPLLDPRLTIVSARAPLSYRWGGYMWFDFETEGPALGGAKIERSLELLDTFLGEIPEAYDLNPNGIILGGFSQGAAMAGAYSLLHPDRVTGTVMASGFLPPDPTGHYRPADAAGLPIFQAHGTHDAIVSLQYAHMTRDFLRATPVELTYREYPMGHEVSQQELAELSAWVEELLVGKVFR